MNAIEKIMLENKAWASAKLHSDPNYFERQVREQNPNFFWIGCSDSRVPANEVTNTEPGEIFVHRNVANLVVNTDLNMLSVLQYAVEVLKVKDIIVCGHYGCGGVKAALHNQSFGMLNKWLRNIKDVYRIHRDEINAISNEDKRVDALVELNVKEQVLNLAKTSIIQRAWLNHQRPAIHGWVYDIKDGILRDLIRVDHTYQLDPIYRYDENELR
jgi:carbonic anhydrase